jgi:hypothetical protein
MYDQGNLASLPTGPSSFYIEMKNSGGCFFEASYIVEGFALPGVPANEYNFVMGLCSGSTSLSERSPWVAQEVDYGGYKFYMWTLPGGVHAQIQGITNCGNQLCIGWLIPSPGDEATGDKLPPSAPFTSVKDSIPEDGSDRQGEPGR